MQNTVPISTNEKSLIQTTFPKIAMRSETITDLFYSQLYWADQSLIPLFEKSPREQGRILMRMLGKAIALLDEPDTLIPVIQELGVRHAGYGVKKKDYKIFGTALMSSLELVLGESVFNADVKAAWTVFYNMLASIAIEAAYE